MDGNECEAIDATVEKCQSTKMAKIYSTYYWHTTLTPLEKFYHSPLFCAKGYEHIQFGISMMRITDKINLYVVPIKNDIRPVKIEYHCAIENIDGESFEGRNRSNAYHVDNAQTISQMTISCEINFTIPDVNVAQRPHIERFKKAEHKLSENFERIFGSDILSDAVLVVDNYEIPIHKAILSARSIVFAAMFHHDMLEKNQNRVVIMEMDYAVVKEMLRFIYTGKALNLENIADGLLAAANMFALNGLKKMCEKALFKELSLENAIELLILAELHNSTKLRNRIINFIFLNIDNFVYTDKWIRFKTEYKYLFEEFASKRAGFYMDLLINYY